MKNVPETQAGSVGEPDRIRRIVAVSIAVATLIGGSVVVGQSATAANNCDSNLVCLWDYANYTGRVATRPGNGTLVDLVDSAADKTAAWGNDTVYDGCLYDEPDGVGVLDELDSYSSDYFNVDRRDRAESWKTNGSC